MMKFEKDGWNGKENPIEHTKNMNEKFSKEIEEAVKNTIIYDVDFVSTKSTEDKNTKFILEALDSVSAVLKYFENEEKMAVLNFSSYRHPGGGYINGAKAQEECLCHESFLYNVLSQFETEFYGWNENNKNKALYLNRGMYSPKICFIKEDRQCFCDVITCAAPNKSVARRWQKVTEEENLQVLKSRIKFVLDIAKENEVNTLILGAYGCGVFGQNATEVAQIFKDYLETEYKCFDKVVFAIPETREGNYLKFKQVFSESN